MKKKMKSNHIQKIKPALLKRCASTKGTPWYNDAWHCLPCSKAQGLSNRKEKRIPETIGWLNFDPVKNSMVKFRMFIGGPWPGKALKMPDNCIEQLMIKGKKQKSVVREDLTAEMLLHAWFQGQSRTRYQDKDQALLVHLIPNPLSTPEKCSAHLRVLTSQQFESSLQSRRTNPVPTYNYDSSWNLQLSLLRSSLRSSTDLLTLVIFLYCFGQLSEHRENHLKITSRDHI